MCVQGFVDTIASLASQESGQNLREFFKQSASTIILRNQQFSSYEEFVGVLKVLGRGKTRSLRKAIRGKQLRQLSPPLIVPEKFEFPVSLLKDQCSVCRKRKKSPKKSIRNKNAKGMGKANFSPTKQKVGTCPFLSKDRAKERKKCHEVKSKDCHINISANSNTSGSFNGYGENGELGLVESGTGFRRRRSHEFTGTGVEKRELRANSSQDGVYKRATSQSPIGSRIKRGGLEITKSKEILKAGSGRYIQETLSSSLKKKDSVTSRKVNAVNSSKDSPDGSYRSTSLNRKKANLVKNNADEDTRHDISNANKFQKKASNKNSLENVADCHSGSMSSSLSANEFLASNNVVEEHSSFSHKQAEVSVSPQLDQLACVDELQMSSLPTELEQRCDDSAREKTIVLENEGSKSSHFSCLDPDSKSGVDSVEYASAKQDERSKGEDSNNGVESAKSASAKQGESLDSAAVLETVQAHDAGSDSMTLVGSSDCTCTLGSSTIGPGIKNSADGLSKASPVSDPISYKKDADPCPSHTKNDALDRASPNPLEKVDYTVNTEMLLSSSHSGTFNFNSDVLKLEGKAEEKLAGFKPFFKDDDICTELKIFDSGNINSISTPLATKVFHDSDEQAFETCDSEREEAIEQNCSALIDSTKCTLDLKTPLWQHGDHTLGYLDEQETTEREDKQDLEPPAKDSLASETASVYQECYQGYADSLTEGLKVEESYVFKAQNSEGSMNPPTSQPVTMKATRGHGVEGCSSNGFEIDKSKKKSLRGKDLTIESLNSDTAYEGELPAQSGSNHGEESRVPDASIKTLSKQAKGDSETESLESREISLHEESFCLKGNGSDIGIPEKDDKLLIDQDSYLDSTTAERTADSILRELNQDFYWEEPSSSAVLSRKNTRTHSPGYQRVGEDLEKSTECRNTQQVKEFIRIWRRKVFQRKWPMAKDCPTTGSFPIIVVSKIGSKNNPSDDEEQATGINISNTCQGKYSLGTCDKVSSLGTDVDTGLAFKLGGETAGAAGSIPSTQLLTVPKSDERCCKAYMQDLVHQHELLSASEDISSSSRHGGKLFLGGLHEGLDEDSCDQGPICASGDIDTSDQSSVSSTEPTWVKNATLTRDKEDKAPNAQVHLASDNFSAKQIESIEKAAGMIAAESQDAKTIVKNISLDHTDSDEKIVCTITSDKPLKHRVSFSYTNPELGEESHVRAGRELQVRIRLDGTAILPDTKSTHKDSDQLPFAETHTFETEWMHYATAGKAVIDGDGIDNYSDTRDAGVDADSDSVNVAACDGSDCLALPVLLEPVTDLVVIAFWVCLATTIILFEMAWFPLQ